MGCCFSSPQPDQTSPYPHNNTTTTTTAAPNAIVSGAPDASSRNITAQSPPRPSSLNSPRASSHDSNRQPTHPPPTIAPNKPLKPLDPSKRCQLPNSNNNNNNNINNSSSRSRRHHHQRQIPLSLPADAPWTRKRLDFERAAFWDTRTNSQPEFWQAARLAVELLQKGDVAEAQGIVDAVGITCPRGEVWMGLFDERGELLSVPDWVVLEPEGLVEEHEDEGACAGEGEMREVLEKSEGEELEDDDDDMEKLGFSERGGKRDKGKGKAAVVQVKNEEVLGELVRIRCRLSTSGMDYFVKVGLEQRVGVLGEKLKEYAGLSHPQKIRFVYLGRVLNDHQKLSQTGWREGNILNAFVFDSTPQT